MFSSTVTNKMVYSLASLPLTSDGKNLGSIARRFVCLKGDEFSYVDTKNKASSLLELSTSINKLLPDVQKKLSVLQAISSNERDKYVTDQINTLNNFKRRAVVINAKIHCRNKKIAKNEILLKTKNMFIRFFAHLFGKKMIKEVNPQYLRSAFKRNIVNIKVIGKQALAERTIKDLSRVTEALELISTAKNGTDVLAAMATISESYGRILKIAPKALMKLKEELDQSLISTESKPRFSRQGSSTPVDHDALLSTPLSSQGDPEVPSAPPFAPDLSANFSIPVNKPFERTRQAMKGKISPGEFGNTKAGHEAKVGLETMLEQFQSRLNEREKRKVEGTSIVTPLKKDLTQEETMVQGILKRQAELNKHADEDVSMEEFWET